MNQQQYRLLCMDIDGTLLNSAHELPSGSCEAAVCGEERRDHLLDERTAATGGVPDS